jgi:4'-phosphopantetheinyl transferase
MKGPKIDVWVYREPLATSREIVSDVLRRYPIGQTPRRTSVSHTEGLLVVATTASCRVGVDAEVIKDRGVRLLPRHALTVFEQAELSAHDRHRQLTAFLSYWTRKEALLKAAGVGLTIEPNLIELPPPHTGTHVKTLPTSLGDAKTWSVTELTINGYAAAVAVDRPAPRIVLHTPKALASTHGANPTRVAAEYARGWSTEDQPRLP